MKKHFMNFGLVLILWVWPASFACAEGSWWDTGIDILKSINGETQKDSSGVIQQGLSSNDIRDAFKQALRIGTENVVDQLGIAGGFNADPTIHIPLPEQLQTVQELLARIGMSSLTDDLELKLNRAAEAATPKAKKLFYQAITEMTFEDVNAIYNGPEDSATQYFRRKMSEPLKVEMRPIVEKTLSQVGAVNAYDQFIDQYKTIPMVPDIKANLTEHVLQRGLEGIFHYLAEEEASIRQNPAKQTTALLKKVFGVN
jgi:hypothetical protein